MSVFVTLYNLALAILTAPANSQLGKLTRHHYATHQRAEATLQTAILQRTMPGEEPGTPWGILRVFMRNLVNGSYAAIDPDDMLGRLNRIEEETQNFFDRCNKLVASMAGIPRLRRSLAAFLDPRHAPCNATDYIDWVTGRLSAYSALPVGDIDPNVVLHDLCTMASSQDTKIPGMGIPYAANFFADLGVRSVAKPDLHVKPTVQGLFGRQFSKPACIAKVIELAKHESLELQESRCFAWLTGGLYPRDIDRIIYLIGSDNFLLNGDRNRRLAPRRRELLLAKLLEQP